jgi:hypothetical protein
MSFVDVWKRGLFECLKESDFVMGYGYHSVVVLRTTFSHLASQRKRKCGDDSNRFTVKKSPSWGLYGQQPIYRQHSNPD